MRKIIFILKLCRTYFCASSVYTSALKSQYNFLLGPCFYFSILGNRRQCQRVVALTESHVTTIYGKSVSASQNEGSQQPINTIAICIHPSLDSQFEWSSYSVWRCVSVIFLKLAECDVCSHWTHLQFCSKVKVIRKFDGFRCPHCKVNSQQICLSAKYLVDNNLLFLCYNNQSFTVVTEIPKLVFSGTIVTEYLWRVFDQLAAYY